MNPLQIQFMLGRFKVTADVGKLVQDTPGEITPTTLTLLAFVLGLTVGAIGFPLMGIQLVKP